MDAWTVNRPSRKEDNSSGRKSSIGSVKTLRSKLHSQRVTLNEAIEKENMFLQGSQRLASITTDPKSKDEATLQKDFAESKIKTLQAELTIINSSLHAYQAESAKEVQVPIIPLSMKTTTTLDLTPTLATLIATHYYTDPEELEESMQTFNELRQKVSSVERSEDGGVKHLLEYYNHLVMVSKRLLNSQLNHNVSFVWYDAINGLPSMQKSTVFERACIMFNVGALYSQLAAKVDRYSSEALDTAIRLLEHAVGVFEYMKEKFSHSPMVDMAGEVLTLLSDLMRAQAQEMVWEKELLGNEKEKDDLMSLMDHSHRAKSVAECFQPVRELVDDETIRNYLPDVWVAMIRIKDAHYKALAHYYAARTHYKLALIYEEKKHVTEDVRTEILFLYLDCPQEVLTNHPKLHIGLMKSHLNCALLSHEYALKFCNLCRDLHHLSCLTKMLSEAQELTLALQEETVDLEGVAMIAPIILSCKTNLTVRFPNFKLFKVDDLFASLGPLPMFSAEESWSSPRCVLLTRTKGSFGFSVRGSLPVIVTSLESMGSAERSGIKVHDWVLSVNGVDVKYKTNGEVVVMVKACKDEVTLHVTTPELSSSERAETETAGSSAAVPIADICA